MSDRRKKYSTYNNLKSDEYNKKLVIKGSITVANLSNYEKLNRIESHLYFNKGRSHSIRDNIKKNKDKLKK